LFFREALHYHLQFLPLVDARAQMLLEFCYGKLFVAGLAFFNGVSFPVSSESGNLMSVEKTLGCDYCAVLVSLGFIRVNLLLFLIIVYPNRHIQFS
jgi:hypothetical protein